MLATHTNTGKCEPITVARFVDHPSFHEKNASVVYRFEDQHEPSASHLPDDETRELAKCMHYAAYRLGIARGLAQKMTWSNRYLELRNRIVMGNHKLVYRAVQTRIRDRQLAEDCQSECHLVMIRAVASYNPFLGIRFSTYAFTCLLRELGRLLHKQVNDRLRQANSFDDDVPFEANLEAKPLEEFNDVPTPAQILANDNSLLSDREKRVLLQRFGFNAEGKARKLGDIGNELNLSKERVRQLQISGLTKLRDSLRSMGV